MSSNVCDFTGSMGSDATLKSDVFAAPQQHVLRVGSVATR